MRFRRFALAGTSVSAAWAIICGCMLALWALAPLVAPAQAQVPASQTPQLPFLPEGEAAIDGLRDAAIRLPLAAALGAALALRPKRRGTPARTTAVVQTQIILAVVGAV